MVPPKTDPKWAKFLSNLGSVPANDLSVKMMMSRIKIKILFDPSDAARQQAISDAFTFFTKNEAALKEDIKTFFA